jgi:hypothetical protein
MKTSGDPVACTCNRFDTTSGPAWCPVHYVQTTWYPAVLSPPLPLSAVSIEVDARGTRVVITIDGIRFVTDAADKDQAIALALRVARALGIRYTPEV